MRKTTESGEMEQGARVSYLLHLDVKKAQPPPSFFLCPISLEVMRSPVSLCTGITYDRSSIQRWLDSGNNICPATMQPLLSTDLVPNLTLRRLINIWSSSLATGDHNLLPLSDIARFLSDPSANDVVKHQIVSADALRPSSLASLLHSPTATLHETLEPTVAIISHLLSLNFVDTEHKRGLIATLLSNLESTVAALITIINGAATLSSQIAVARVLEAVVSASPPDSEARMLIAEKLDLMAGLVRLIGECDKEAVEVGLQCLMELIGCDPSASSSTSLSARKVRTDMARAGIVPTLTLVLERDAEELLMPAGERAMRAMEAMAECAEGRAAICAESKRCVEAVLGKMMKVRNEGKLAAVALLWSLCCAGCGDRRAREAVAGSKGAMAKILMVMQGDCSPVVRRMAADLLRVFPAEDRGSIAAAGYDTNTIHIMPF